MGEVFRAQDRLTGQLVALKRIRLPFPTAPVDGNGNARLGKAATVAANMKPLLPAMEPNEGWASRPLAAAQQPRTPAVLETVSHLSLAGTSAHPPAEEGAVWVDAGVVGALEPPSLSKVQALRLHLAQEFHTLAGLRHPHIVSVLDYGFDRDHQPYFTMELLENARTLDESSRDQPLAVKLGLLLQVLQALDYLHRRGILHRDLKPSNIVVIQAAHGLQVKLLDFGLALWKPGINLERPEVAGTVGYIAPEILLGAIPSAAADLFAVGIIAHELLLGEHPRAARQTAEIIQDFLGSENIFTEDARLPPMLAAVLRRALCRAPTERFADAASFGQALAQATGLPLPLESIEIRESFLQAASFVAREEELASLRQALEQACAGNGGVWLVGGESGVGKSRLLEELRTWSLVHGTQVVRGQAINAGAATYQIWQGVLRPLCLDVELDDLDAGVLSAAVSDIAMLLERPIPEPPLLDPQSAQARFLLTVEKLLLGRQEPLLILLEDLHWAEPASLAVLQRLVRSVKNSCLIVVGSYRNDERPTLPDELPGTQSLALHRFSTNELAQLSASMLGERGRRQEIVTLLERETEGNVFFVVEVVRALAEEAGTLGNIGSGRIPSRVIAGGVQAILMRRLGRVPEGVKPLLYAAAVLGRELDLTVLRALPENLGGQVDTHLSMFVAAAVLEVTEDRWRFAHDKLREALLGELTAEVRSGWHLQIAEAIERAYATDHEPHAAVLAYHFDAAHLPARALPYMLQFGACATRSGAVQEGIIQLQRAVQIIQSVGCSQAERTHALALLCVAYHGAGKPEECTQVLERMLSSAGFPVSNFAASKFSDIARLVARHAWFRLGLGAAPSAEAPQDIAWTSEIADTFATVAEAVSITRSPAEGMQMILAWVVMAERLGDPAAMAPSYACVAGVLMATPLRGLMHDYLKRAQELLGQSPNPPPAAQAMVKMAEAAVSIGVGQWETASRCLHDELAQVRRSGDWRRELFALVQSTAVASFQGEPQVLLDLTVQLDRLASKVDSAQYLCWARGIFARHALDRGEFELAQRLFSEADSYQARARDPIACIFIAAHSALCALRMGAADLAMERADAALDLLRSRVYFGYALAEQLGALCEVYLTAWRAARDTKERNTRQRKLQQSLDLLRTYGAAFAIGRAKALLWHGRYAAHRGHKRLAGWLLQKALQSAVLYRIPFDEALVHQALADLRYSSGEPTLAIEARRRAAELFAQVGATHYVSQVS